MSGEHAGPSQTGPGGRPHMSLNDATPKLTGKPLDGPTNHTEWLCCVAICFQSLNAGRLRSCSCVAWTWASVGRVQGAGRWHQDSRSQDMAWLLPSIQGWSTHNTHCFSLAGSGQHVEPIYLPGPPLPSPRPKENRIGLALNTAGTPDKDREWLISFAHFQASTSSRPVKKPSF